MLLLIFTVHFVDKLRSKKDLIASEHCTVRSRIAHLVQRVMKEWTPVREPGGLGLLESPVQPYLYLDYNLARSSILASQAHGYPHLE